MYRAKGFEATLQSAIAQSAQERMSRPHSLSLRALQNRSHLDNFVWLVKLVMALRMDTRDVSNFKLINSFENNQESNYQLSRQRINAENNQSTHIPL